MEHISQTLSVTNLNNKWYEPWRYLEILLPEWSTHGEFPINSHFCRFIKKYIYHIVWVSLLICPLIPLDLFYYYYNVTWQITCTISNFHADSRSVNAMLRTSLVRTMSQLPNVIHKTACYHSVIILISLRNEKRTTIDAKNTMI